MLSCQTKLRNDISSRPRPPPPHQIFFVQLSFYEIAEEIKENMRCKKKRKKNKYIYF